MLQVYKILDLTQLKFLLAIIHCYYLHFIMTAFPY